MSYILSVLEEGGRKTEGVSVMEDKGQRPKLVIEKTEVPLTLGGESCQVRGK